MGDTDTYPDVHPLSRPGAFPMRGLLGAEMAEALARISPPRRSRVYVVSGTAVPDAMFRVAVAVGAENVTQVARSEGRLTELLTDLGDAAPAQGVVVGV